MSNIEEDIKEYKINLTQEQSIELLKNALNKFEILGEGLCLLKIAIKNVLSEREADKKRIKELEEINTANRKVIVEQCDYIQNKSIPVQKVKDKIEENNKIMIDTQNKYPGTYAMLDEWRNAKAQNDILEELLEEK